MIEKETIFPERWTGVQINKNEHRTSNVEHPIMRLLHSTYSYVKGGTALYKVHHVMYSDCMIKEHESVVLVNDLPAAGLMAGDVGVVVHVYEAGNAYEVEFITLDGNTVAVETLAAGKVRSIRAREIPHVRELVVA